MPLIYQSVIQSTRLAGGLNGVLSGELGEYPGVLRWAARRSATLADVTRGAAGWSRLSATAWPTFRFRQVASPFPLLGNWLDLDALPCLLNPRPVCAPHWWVYTSSQEMLNWAVAGARIQ